TARCEVVVLSQHSVAATSLADSAQADAFRLSRTDRPGFGVREGLQRLGSRQFVVGTFPLQPDDGAAAGSLVLLADWQPTEQFVERLRARFLVSGFAAFGLALGVGLVFSRGVSRPLRDIATAASKIADGDLAMTLPVRGSAEAVTV